ncbi:MAG: phage antirepressor Ant [Clostridiales bacterium]|nr:phage antirepressor Ant [Clostridiales bacterium]
MNEIISIQGIDCYEKDGTAYLRLEPVARGLGFTQKAASGNEVVRWERVRKYLSEFGVPTCGDGDFIPENIFYRLAMKAKNEAAERFQAKIADEVVPSIRKHGAYMTPETLQAAILDPDYLLQIVTTLKEEKDKRQALEVKVEADKPKVLFAEAVSVSDDSILVGALAKIIKQNGVDIGQQRLFVWLRENGYLMKSGRDYNLPTQKSMESGLFKIKERTINNPDGSVRITRTVLVTGKGQQYFINKFLAV